MADRCKDCVAEGVTTKRELVAPGPRCATHARTARRMSSARAHDAAVARRYGIPRGFYEALLADQDGRCCICLRSTGKARRLAVDHDHSLEGARSVRGLLCHGCNDALAWARSDPEQLRRAARYLEDPPAQRVLIAWNGESPTESAS